MAKAAVRLINGLAEGIRENAPLVKSAANNLLDAILESIPGGSLLKVGKDLASGLAEGIGAGISWVADAAKNIADKAVSTAKKALDSHSPSKKFIKIGKDTGAGMAIGIDDGSKVAIKSSKAMATDVIEASSRALKLSSRARAGFDRLNLGVGKTAGLASAAQMITNAVTNNSNSSTKNSNNKAEVNIYTEVKSNTPTERELARQTKVQLRDLGYSFG
jgi:phage-related protein